MNKSIVLLCLLVALTACSQQNTIANPASENCENLGGTLEIRTATDGSQTGYCTLPNGSVCEEWALYEGECS